jgi:hypothetical protein
MFELKLLPRFGFSSQEMTFRLKGERGRNKTATYFILEYAAFGNKKSVVVRLSGFFVRCNLK